MSVRQEGGDALVGVGADIRIKQIVVVNVIAAEPRQRVGESAAVAQWDCYREFTAIAMRRDSMPQARRH